MLVSFRQSWQLRRIERRLRRSAPHMAAMLAMFARLYAGEAIRGREQLHPPGWARLFLARLRRAVVSLLLALCWLLRRVAGGCAAAGRWWRGVPAATLHTSSGRDGSGSPGRSLGP